MLEEIPSTVGGALSGLRPAVQATLARTGFGEGPETTALGGNLFGTLECLPPGPPSGHGVQRYAIRAFAPGRSAVVAALKGKDPAKGVPIGTCERP